MPEKNTPQTKKLFFRWGLAIAASLFFIVVSFLDFSPVSTSNLSDQPASTDSNNEPPPSPVPADPNLMAEVMKEAAATLGDPNAPIVFVEYSDYQCPLCRRFFEKTLNRLKQEYVKTGKVFFVLKDYPLPGHDGAKPAAMAARCAGEQEKYWEMHDKVFEEQGKQGVGTIAFGAADLKKWAREIGLNATEFDACLDSEKYLSIVKSNFRDGITIGVAGTPTMAIGKKEKTRKLVVGAQPFDTFKKIIDELIVQ